MTKWQMEPRWLAVCATIGKCQVKSLLDIPPPALGILHQAVAHNPQGPWWGWVQRFRALLPCSCSLQPLLSALQLPWESSSCRAYRLTLKKWSREIRRKMVEQSQGYGNRSTTLSQKIILTLGNSRISEK